MHHNGELSHLKNSKNCKENIIAPALELIKKKKSFKKSKFYVEDIPHPKKTTRQVQLIDIDGMSPETFKTKERPKKNKKSASK
ncbi:MAG: hypothetical protein JST59_01845 [Actinobacteria bacterium]|nr:hypothetical protein [Actinomycetota bacterium]